MSQNQFSFQECFNELNGQLYGYALKKGLNKFDAEDVVQDAWINVYKRLKQDKDLLHRFETETVYSRKYIFKSTINGIRNKIKSQTTQGDEYKDNLIQSNENNSPVETPTKRKRWKPRFVEIVEDKIRTKLKDPIEKNQRNEAVQKFIEDLKKVLKDDENEFLDLYLEVAEQNISVNISEVARIMGVNATKAHDIFRRVKRKAQAFEAKNNMLKDVAAPAAIFGFGIFDFFKEIFKPRYILDKKYQKAGERISEKVLSELGIDAISTFSKFVK